MLELIFIISLFTQGLFVSGHSPYVLNGIRHRIATSLGGVYRESLAEGEVWYEFNGIMNEIWKPVWGCPVCMSSFWGVVIYSIFIPYTWDSIYQLPMVIIGTACVNFVIFNNLIKRHL